MGAVKNITEALLSIALDDDSSIWERALTLSLSPLFGLIGLGFYAWGTAVAKDRAEGADPDEVYRVVSAKIDRLGKGRRELTPGGVFLWGSDGRRRALNWALDDSGTVPVPYFLEDFV